MTIFKMMTTISIAVISLLMSCGGGNKPTQNIAVAKDAEPIVKMINKLSPTYGTKTKQGSVIDISYVLETDAATDSVVLFVDNKRIGTIDTLGYKYNIPANHHTGRLIYKITAYQGGDSETRSGECTVMAASTPAPYGYKVRATYPHSTGAYTQGLLFHNDNLYESTGQEGGSSIRKVDIASGNVLLQKDMTLDQFGEGLALIDNKLYQLTWQNNKAYVYDHKSFELLNEFTYSGEGWGLTTDGNHLYMTDGSERINVIDPKTFKIIRTIYAYTNEVKIQYLNELEWINGEIWANVYGSNAIVRIDPTTGVVTGIIDLTGILPRRDMDSRTDVLNGIAYDSASGKIYVTGKYWSKLFEIDVIKK